MAGVAEKGNDKDAADNDDDDDNDEEEDGQWCDICQRLIDTVLPERAGRHGQRDRKAKKRSKKKEIEAIRLENLRLVKWVGMMRQVNNDWAELARQKEKLLRRRIRKGVPEAFRGKVWHALSGASEMQQKSAHTYEEQVQKAETLFGPGDAEKNAKLRAEVRALLPTRIKEWDDVIAADLGRTYPRHVVFIQPEGVPHFAAFSARMG